MTYKDIIKTVVGGFFTFSGNNIHKPIISYTTKKDITTIEIAIHGGATFKHSYRGCGKDREDMEEWVACMAVRELMKKGLGI